MKYDVFISFKNSGKDGKPTVDAVAAQQVYEALKDKGIKVFFSEGELAKMGKGYFSTAIENALESAKVLVLVASCRENIDSPFVSAEWGAFLNAIRSSHKQGELFIFDCGSLKPADLPLFLRQHQMLPSSGLDKLVEFVRNALPTPTRLKDLIRASLHCYWPEINEDKIYLVTVHSPDEKSHTVMAHYGSRLSKRLVSQVKHAGLKDPVDVNNKVQAIINEKGAKYKPVAYGKLLTREAKWLLEASLGMRSKPKSRAFDEVRSPAADATSIHPKLKAQLLEVLSRAHQGGEAAAQIIQELARANAEFSFLRSILSEFKAKASSSPLQNRHE